VIFKNPLSIPKHLIQVVQLIQNPVQNATPLLSDKLFVYQTVNCHHTVKTSRSRVAQSKKQGMWHRFLTHS
jgi:hypothetical protein